MIVDKIGKIVSTVKQSWTFAWKRMMIELAPQDKTGSYARPKYSFNGKIGSQQFPDEAGRYYLFVGNPCPWCHRTSLVCAIRKFSVKEIKVIKLVDDPLKASRGGWVFSKSDPDPIYNSVDLRTLYDSLNPGFQGRCTAPLLVDGVSKTIVSNESADICRMLEKATFGRETLEGIDLYPSELSSEINDTNEWVYKLLNNGVYRCGFATEQAAYDSASNDVRTGLNRCEKILERQAFLCGNKFTEADLRLLPTILRFDAVYAPLFKAGGTHLRIKDFPSLLAWLQRCWDIEGVQDSIDIKDATLSYYKQLFPLNPGGILPTSITPAEIGLR